MPEYTHEVLVFYVNGKRVEETNPDPERTLSDYLRRKLHLTGTKIGCSEGGCGACTVMVSRHDRQKKSTCHYAVNACLAPLCSMHGLAVTTVEGIGSTRERLHPIQERIAKSFGSQCGFCTPGIVMSLYSLLHNNTQPSMEEMENAFAGNLCRCTGYRPILEGFKTFTKGFQCSMGKDCCKNKTDDAVELFKSSEFVPYDSSQEPIFPPDLQMSSEYDVMDLKFVSDRCTWYRPTTLERLLEIKSDHPDARIIIGNTEVGIELKYKNMHYPVLVCVTNVPQLNQVDHVKGGVKVGAAVTLTQLKDVLDEEISKQPEYKTRVFKAIVEMLHWFAGHQIRNVAALGGNLCTASPISDLNPILLAAGCELSVVSLGEDVRTIQMSSSFFKGYRKTSLKSTDVLVSILIPYTKEEEYILAYKQSHRREDDIAIVNSALRVEFEQKSAVVKDAAFSFGGMAPITVATEKTTKQIIGRKWNGDLLTDTVGMLLEDLPLPPGAPGGMEPYRQTLCLSFFYKFYLTVAQQLIQKGCLSEEIPADHLCATLPYHREQVQGVQVFEAVDEAQSDSDPVGRPVVHVAALQQATGEALYCDDITSSEDELHLAFVLSSKAHAKLVSVDWSKAKSMPGVVTTLNWTDVPGSNLTGHFLKDEEIFAKEEVTSVGQIIGAVVAESPIQAQRAARAVIVAYKELPRIITIEEAIEAKSFFTPIRTLKKGDVDKALNTSENVLEGEFRIGGQEHFYMEPQVALARPPGEQGELEIFSSTQAPSKDQAILALALGVPANRINIRVKRLGGGFGGKETNASLVSIPVAIAAKKLNRPVRCVLDRQDDMTMTGTRHPFLGKYKVGFQSSGEIVALDVKLFSNGGHSIDSSCAVMERAMFHIDNAYRFPNVRVTGCVCRTNTPSNTAFRGFGGPQGMWVTESILHRVAGALNKPATMVKEMNLYEEGDCTPFTQELTHCHLKKCWSQVLEQSKYQARREKIQEFNSCNRWKKRGIAVVPVKFGIAFTALFLNQAGALVNIYVDGSVTLWHSGVEMGQGLHTKMIQVASRALQIPADKIHILETNTHVTPNMSPTAASASADLNGMAVMKACHSLRERLEPFIAENPKGSWEDWVSSAYFSRVSLSANGFYSTENIGFDWDRLSGDPFKYFSMGAAATEVEVDCLTGDHTVLATDIVMDVGKSLNPGIDIGQIEGAFVQGYGLFTLEEQRYTPEGVLLTKGPGMYKIPGFTDIPVQFNVTLLKEVSNPKAVYSSKAIGEPPLFLASSAFFAILEAVSSARMDAGLEVPFRFDSPATAERIRMACGDQFTTKCPYVKPDRPWFVVL